MGHGEAQSTELPPYVHGWGVAGMAMTFALGLLVLCSFRPIPEYDGPDFPDWWKPAAASEVMPAYRDFNIPPEYLKTVVRYCAEGAPVFLVARMASTESSPHGEPTDIRWNPKAVSYMGAIGMTQIMPGNATDPLFIGFNDGKPVDLTDPETQLRLGIRYLIWLHGQLGRWDWAVQAYNVGPRAWLRARGFANLPAETQGYSKDIMGGAA